MGMETSAAGELSRPMSDGSFERGLERDVGRVPAPYKAIHVKKDTRIERTGGV